MIASDRPLVSFVIFAYNQEALVADAFAGAIAQTYSPMEIILSDDCSPDRTFARFEQLAAAYDGPHHVRLNRNETNLHIGGHVQKVADLAKGELIVINAGDDISEPDRVEQLVSAWLSSGRQADLLHSDVSKIDIAGQPFGSIVKPAAVTQSRGDPIQLAISGESVIGATQAWSRRLFENFPPLSSQVTAEDLVLPFRATLLGGMQYVPAALVQHREGGISADFLAHTAQEALWGSGLKVRRWFSASLRQMLRDIDHRPDLARDPKLREVLTTQLALHEAPLMLATAPYRQRWKLAFRLLRNRQLPLRDRLRPTIMYLAPALWSLQLTAKRRFNRM